MFQIFQGVLQILWQVIAPIFLMMSCGFLVQRKLGFDIRSLTRLNFWIFVPAFLFTKIYSTKLSNEGLATVGAHFCLLFGAMSVISYLCARLTTTNERLRRVMTASVLFYNSGNYGVPAAQLAFPHSTVAEGVQAITMTLQNFTNFTIGLSLMASGREGMTRKEMIMAMLRLPMIHTFVAAAVWRSSGQPVPEPMWRALEYLAGGLVPIALITLGAQMATLKSYRFRHEMALTLFLRLMLAPVVGFLFLKVVGATGILAQSLLVSTSFPSAINSALLAIEYDSEPEFAAATVFYSTLISSVTVSLVIYAATHWLH